jgi:hypothetical protein
MVYESNAKRKWLAIASTILIFFVSLQCEDQATGDATPVIETVSRFFVALAEKDTALARTVMMPEGRFYSVREDGAIRAQTHEAFFERISGEESDLLERMWEPTVLVHGRIAVLWTPYDFHRDGRFSHCGIDAFSLIKTDTGWKIAGTVYTVEREGCPESPLGPPE